MRNYFVCAFFSYLSDLVLALKELMPECEKAKDPNQVITQAYLGHCFKIVFELFHVMGRRPLFQNKIID